MFNNTGDHRLSPPPPQKAVIQQENITSQLYTLGMRPALIPLLLHCLLKQHIANGQGIAYLVNESALTLMIQVDSTPR